MHTNPNLPRIHALVLVAGWLLLTPLQGPAFVWQAAAQQEPAPLLSPPTPPGQPPANPPAPASPPRAKTSTTPKEQAWREVDSRARVDSRVDSRAAVRAA